mmetsp:Transcript_26173/g.65813  ORF Transcript_26173/g.65813 Transcript_26173/m.65813 type:complete len:236 (-) Transcript_26173:1892-2599(-)
MVEMTQPHALCRATSGQMGKGSVHAEGSPTVVIGSWLPGPSGCVSFPSGSAISSTSTSVLISSTDSTGTPATCETACRRLCACTSPEPPPNWSLISLKEVTPRRLATSTTGTRLYGRLLPPPPLAETQSGRVDPSISRQYLAHASSHSSGSSSSAHSLHFVPLSSSSSSSSSSPAPSSSSSSSSSSEPELASSSSVSSSKSRSMSPPAPPSSVRSASVMTSPGMPAPHRSCRSAE